jgi:hypothetical protein
MYSTLEKKKDNNFARKSMDLLYYLLIGFEDFVLSCLQVISWLGFVCMMGDFHVQTYINLFHFGDGL